MCDNIVDLVNSEEVLTCIMRLHVYLNFKSMINNILNPSLISFLTQEIMVLGILHVL